MRDVAKRAHSTMRFTQTKCIVSKISRPCMCKQAVRDISTCLIDAYRGQWRTRTHNRATQARRQCACAAFNGLAAVILRTQGTNERMFSAFLFKDPTPPKRYEALFSDVDLSSASAVLCQRM